MNREESIVFAQKYLEDLLSFFGANLTVSSTCEDDVIELSVPSNELNSLLIGRNAETLRSMQYIVSTVLRNKDATLTRVNIDIADYKKQRAERVAAEAREWIEEVRRTGDSYVANLNAADRRIVHHVASEYSDIRTFSEGEGRERRITIAQASS
ncbi:MAG TPA: R3H domain-containing nucleic acid-binding protein [Candidatus Saccharibacteria bacterium]|nr:R3H domain-containing nucleic acid-binding protein [Candidatus Saccharibacteria bacterium]HRQ07095.1 R3H domain-containing nucleic acid-binding protein [Candidatus Saccharibacteria bacterium]HRQ98093.1 R3H domain-containing nucleic acid-binding protein [Candidatus Saccharibacteria bacterium]